MGLKWSKIVDDSQEKLEQVQLNFHPSARQSPRVAESTGASPRANDSRRERAIVGESHRESPRVHWTISNLTCLVWSRHLEISYFESLAKSNRNLQCFKKYSTQFEVPSCSLKKRKICSLSEAAEFSYIQQLLKKNWNNNSIDPAKEMPDFIR